MNAVNAKTSSEPSMEEILASIRRIIADDSAQAATPAVSEPPKAEMAAPEPAPAMPDAVDDVLDLDDEPVVAAAPVLVPAAPVVPAPVMAAPAAATLTDERLISAQTDEAVSQAFGSLAGAMFSKDGRSIEDIVKDMLKPMLRVWLDDNLPSIVERLVRAEIERVARGGR
jgi:uncharacterized protein